MAAPRRTVVVTFDYSSLALLELLRRQGGPDITAVFMVNGGLFADSHTHPWQGTPMLRSPLGALARQLNGTVPLYVGGHLTTSEHPDLLAGAIADIASRHGVEEMA
ncbi:hypothetical protein [Kribbella capetownensis]|uniref:hypothetical protein n=1 Tax=Kribbella capetownensis TaxID=1572659 RepID=UPI00192D43B1|nr:hypothetical protein [Kribbella capetownensis]